MCFLALQTQTSWAKPVTIPAEIRPAIIKNLAISYDNQWDKKNQCMQYTIKAANYCVRIIDLQQKTTAHSSQYFLTIAGDAYGSTGTFDDVGHAHSGIMGLFLFKKVDDQWRMVGINKAIPIGQFGISQAKNYQIVKIGLNQYGWVGEETGSGAGGETNTLWSVYAMIDQKLKHIAEFEVNRSYMGSFEVDKQVKLSFIQQADKTGFFPIDARFEKVVVPAGDDGMPNRSALKNIQKQKIIYFNQTKKIYFDPFRD